MKRALAAAAAVATVALLSGCATFEEYALHEKELSYETWADAPTRGDLAFVPADFVPHDATDLRIRTQTNGSGKLYRFESVEGLDTEVCTPSPIEKITSLDAGWWPDEVPAEGTMCAPDWNVFEVDGVTYAFRN